MVLYTYSRARDRRPDPGSVIVGAERKELLEKFVSKWFGVWSSGDEAIAALRASLKTDISPLPRRPYVDEFSITRNPLYIRTIASMPGRIVWNLLIRPIGNKILRGILRGSSLGIDRPGLAVSGVEPWPRIFGTTTNFPSLPSIIDRDLQQEADSALGRSAPALRKVLEDVSLGIDASASLSPETINLLPSALVHTSYFTNRLVMELIYRWLLIAVGQTTVDLQKTMAKNCILTFNDERRRLVGTLLNR